MSVSDIKRFKKLEKENSKLKKIFVEIAFENHILKIALMPYKSVNI